MSERVKSFAAVSRAEFLLPNLGSLIMGLAWGANPPLDLINGIILIALSFIIINLSSAIGAQANTLFDFELDQRDDRKKSLIQALNSFGQKRLRTILIVEFVLTLTLVSLFTLFQGKPILLLMWIAGISLGYAYSAPPLRVKARSWLAPFTLILVLGVLPVLFAYYAFTSELNPFFVLALIGLALTIYGVIVPTEIRDYFGDKAMGIETMTVRLGLVKASLLSIVLLATGSILTATGFLLEWTSGPHPLLGFFLLAIPVPVLFVLTKLRKLYTLSKEHMSSNGKASIAEEITSLSAHNPQWIMMVTQTYSFISILLLVSKFIF